MNIARTGFAAIRRSRLGFSLIEVIFAVGILFMAFMAVFTAMSRGLSSMEAARENLRATQIMLDKMEGVRLYNWAQLTNSTFLVPSFTNWFYETNNIGEATASGSGVEYTGMVVVAVTPFSASYTNMMRAVTVNVGWYSSGLNHTRSMSTFFSENGLQNYVYNSN